MGGNHTKVFCFQIAGDASNEDWASYSNVSVFTAHEPALTSGEALLTKLDGENVFSDTFSGDPFAAKRPGINALDLYFSPSSDDSEVVCAFKIESPSDDQNGKSSLVFDSDRPFLIGDTGWPEPAINTNMYCSSAMPHWAAFKIDVNACRNSTAYKKAKSLREFPFVRFPIAFRVYDRSMKLPASMIPNTHSFDDINRFGNPGHLRLAEMQQHFHDHGIKNDAEDGTNDSAQSEKHNRLPSDINSQSLRHWGPHFASVYSVYLRLD